MLSFELEIYFFQTKPYIFAIYILIIAFMMVSLTPTISVKNLHISKLLLPTLFLCSIFIILLITV